MVTITIFHSGIPELSRLTDLGLWSGFNQPPKGPILLSDIMIFSRYVPGKFACQYQTVITSLFSSKTFLPIPLIFIMSSIF